MKITMTIDGRRYRIKAGTTVAAAVLGLDRAFRRSVRGEPRSALCGMGTCFECRVTIDGQPHQRSCNRLCEAGMEVWTDGV